MTVAAGALALAFVGVAATPAHAYWVYAGGWFNPHSACVAAAKDLRAQGFTILSNCTEYSPARGYLLDARRWVPGENDEES